MCGIALILSGAHIIRCGRHSEPPAPEAGEVHRLVLSVTDLKAALLRRGPDYLGSKKVYLQSKWTHSVKEEKEGNCLNFPFEAVVTEDVEAIGMRSIVELQFLGATLQLRGTSPLFQPLVDASGNLLVYNGEIFGGINVDRDCNDAEVLLDELEKCCSCKSRGDEIKYCGFEKGETSVPDILSKIRGPWSLIYWQARSKTIWFGRDAFGRRSLLVHWPTLEDPRFVLSSVSPPSVIIDNGSTSTIGFETTGVSRASDMDSSFGYWEELPCGIYSICFEVLAGGQDNQQYFGEVNEHEWTDTFLKELIKWERTSVDPKCRALHEQLVFPTPLSEILPSDLGNLEDHIVYQTQSPANILGSTMLNVCLSDSIVADKGSIQLAHKVLISLRESVMRRTTLNTNFQTDQYQTRESVSVALLFSGGLDSMIIAALLDQCLSANYTIDLLNVSFDGAFAPDRISARAGLRELKKIAPSRRWRLVEINADLCKLTTEIKHIMSLISPARTYMDLNIGLALWLAAGGEGIVDGERCNSDEESCHNYKYKSAARVLLVGSGADEQCAGYGRHRTKYRLGGWFALQEEMKLDMQRIWKRNLGRDDRCISDHGKEARFPFLDEDVIRTLLEIPLWEIAELDQPVGRGDKKILREVAQLLGLEEAAAVPKRAIQFGSRIARESNKKNFGSNRAANQASAGSVVIQQSSC